MAQIKPLFAVPIGEAFMPDAEKLNAELKALILEREREPERWRNPYQSNQVAADTFESDFTFFSWPEPCVQTLRDFCWSHLAHLVAQLNGYTPAEMNEIVIQSHTWFHVTRNGGYFGNHNHAMASWSGVYCVSTGESDPAYPMSGVLRMLNPMMLANMFVDPGNQRIRQPYGMAAHHVHFRPGQLILFPSWLIHEVLPFYGQGERITIAFNCWFKRASELRPEEVER